MCVEFLRLLTLIFPVLQQNASATFSPEEVSNGTNKTLAVSGYYWGYVSVFFYGLESTEVSIFVILL